MGRGVGGGGLRGAAAPKKEEEDSESESTSGGILISCKYAVIYGLRRPAKSGLAYARRAVGIAVAVVVVMVTLQVKGGKYIITSIYLICFILQSAASLFNLNSSPTLPLGYRTKVITLQPCKRYSVTNHEILRPQSQIR